ncbi:MAG: CdaR family protein [Pseudomonadota bacterium]
MKRLREMINWNELRKNLRRNSGLRLISVLLAIGLWMFVNAGQRNSVVTLPVPISYRSLPPGYVIVNHPPDFVKIAVTGSRTLLSLLDPERLTLRLDLTGVPVGHTDFKISPNLFNVGRGTMVTRVTPDDAQIDIDRVVSRDLPVHLNLVGPVAKGYQVNSIELQPATISVSGPSRFVAPLVRAETDPFDVRGADADLERVVGIQNPGLAVHLAVVRVLAKVDVGDQIANREFHGVNVEVRDTDFKSRVEPGKVSITVRGPILKLASLDPKGIVYVDAQGGAPGLREMPLEVELPDGMQLVKQEPAKVKLRIYRQKLPDTGDGKAS